MQLLAEKKANTFMPIIYLVLLWGAYTILYSGFKKYGIGLDISMQVQAIFTVLMRLLVIMLSLWLWVKAVSENKKFFAFYTVGAVFALFNTLYYKILIYFLHLPYDRLPQLWILADKLVYFGYLIFTLLAFICILPKPKFFKSKTNLLIYIPAIVVLVSLAFIFFHICKWQMQTFNLLVCPGVVESILQLAIFMVTLLCLVLTKEGGIFYLALNFLITIPTEFIIRWKLFPQNYDNNTGVLWVTIWVLGLFFIIYALYSFKNRKIYSISRKSWFDDPSGLKVQFVFWAFLLINLTSVMFFLATYLFSPRWALSSGIESFLPIFAIVLVATMIASSLFAEKICRPLLRLTNLINLFMEESANSAKCRFNPAEQNVLEFRKHEEFLLKAFSVLRAKLSTEKRLNKLAVQVAHDIRSPLTALQMLSSQTRNLDEENRTLIRNATTRINDIANHLITTYRGVKEDNREKITPELMASIADSILSEKRIQYANFNIQFELIVQPAAQGVFCDVNVGRCKRILSNLIDNSVEAIEKEQLGRVILNLDTDANFLLLEIIDNGCGMSQDLLEKIGVEKFTFNKVNGSGVGLFTAVQQIRNWEGGYTVKSETASGTVFTIRLPITNAPKWFQPVIEITQNMDIIILDDDETIHDIWDVRFKYCREIKLRHFYAQHELENYCKQLSLNQEMQNKHHLYLIDLELLNSTKNGMEIIKEFNVNNAILVTSYYEDQQLRKECLRYNIKIIPKNFSPYIPVKVIGMLDDNFQGNELEQPDLIFIDDDHDLLQAWEMYAASKGTKIAVFNKAEDFDKDKHKYSKNTPIYIDYLLPGIDGITYSKQLFEEGFAVIYLATGYDKEYFRDLDITWLKDIVNKGILFAD